MSEEAISLTGVSVTYGATNAVRNVDLCVKSKRITAFVGPSGSGKTSLLKTLNRMSDLESDCIVEGSIEVEGFGDITSTDTDVVSLRRTVGMIFQKPNPFPFSIRKNFVLPLKEHGVRGAEIDQKIEVALERVGLWDEVSDRLGERADKLSGGQQQRLCIARALVLEPKILLLDEPCSALDPIATEVIERLIIELRESLTLIVVTHNLAQARRIADDVAVFWSNGNSGRIVEFGEATQVFENPKSEFAARYVAGRCG